jgi:exodeoxyribonuclease-3
VLIATWNVNGIRARAQRLAEWLAERKPDVVCLQELKVKDDEFDHAALASAGYRAATHGQAGWNGVAVLARGTAPEIVERGLPGAAADAGARFITVKTNGLEVTSVYIPNGKTVSNPEYKGKLAWLEALAKHVESRADRAAPYLLAGDFNVCTTDLDSYLGSRGHGTIFHTDEERAIIARLAKSGLVDLFRKKHPTEPGFSWWDYRAGAFHRKLGMRLDLLLVTDVVASRLKDVFVDREFRKKSKTSGALASDHAPVIAELA